MGMALWIPEAHVLLRESGYARLGTRLVEWSKFSQFSKTGERTLTSINDACIT